MANFDRNNGPGISMSCNSCLGAPLPQQEFWRNPYPEQLQLYVIADPAQVWPTGRTAGSDALAAIAGPFANILLAGIAYFVWNLQINVFFNLIALFLALFNLLLALINLSPGIPTRWWKTRSIDNLG